MKPHCTLDENLCLCGVQNVLFSFFHLSVALLHFSLWVWQHLSLRFPTVTLPRCLPSSPLLSFTLLSLFSFSPPSVSPPRSGQSLTVVEAALSRARQTLRSQSRTRRSWALMTMSRRTPTTTAGVRVVHISKPINDEYSDLKNCFLIVFISNLE